MQLISNDELQHVERCSAGVFDYEICARCGVWQVGERQSVWMPARGCQRVWRENFRAKLQSIIMHARKHVAGTKERALRVCSMRKCACLFMCV